MAVSEGAPLHGNLAHLLPSGFKHQVSSWLEEDTPSFDYGGFVVGEEPTLARLLGKSKVRQESSRLIKVQY
jgi:nicotinate-nucleotide pyrophosphorylase (carboxylating)